MRQMSFDLPWLKFRGNATLSELQHNATSAVPEHSKAGMPQVMEPSTVGSLLLSRSGVFSQSRRLELPLPHRGLSKQTSPLLFGLRFIMLQSFWLRRHFHVPCQPPAGCGKVIV